MLAGKTILITGSSRGIGGATAKLAIGYGARIILHGKTESANLKNLARELRSEYIFCDLTDKTETSKKIAELGEIDVLINNAGINPSKTFEQLSHEDWLNIFNVNLFGLVNATKAVISKMKENKKGKIINIASIKGLNSVSGKPAYAASKAAVIRLTSSLAEELAPFNITVNAVAPGFTETEMTASTLSPQIERQISKIPLKRKAEASEIAEAVLFLASNRADYITGQTLVVDGGYSIAG